MSVELPSCPFTVDERAIIKRYIDRQDIIDTAINKLRARSFGRQLLGSLQLRYNIARYRGLQRAAESAYDDLVSPEAIDLFKEWQDDLATVLESY